jgi:hypothetical protein
VVKDGEFITAAAHAACRRVVAVGFNTCKAGGLKIRAALTG